MKIYLIRHGETEENLRGIVQGHFPGKLTPKGIIQAEKLAEEPCRNEIYVIEMDENLKARALLLNSTHHLKTVP
ncbi:MAG: histidine phosphatase family protein [Fidelibacterota bacterium]